MKAEILILLAGVHAEMRFVSDELTDGARIGMSEDMANVNARLDALSYEGDDKIAFRLRCERCLQGLLGHLEERIRCVASRLIDSETLEQPELTDLLGPSEAVELSDESEYDNFDAIARVANENLEMLRCLVSDTFARWAG